MIFREKFLTTLILLSFLTLTGCTNQATVHLYTRYIDDTTTDSIRTKLEQAGLNVKTNNFNFPRNITTTSILYSPLLEQPDAIDITKDSLKKLGFEINSLSPLVSSNHWYTKNSLGLFVVPSGTVTYSANNPHLLAYTYQSHDCEKNMELTLDKTGYFEYRGEDNELLTGRWSITSYPYVLLENSVHHFSYYFEIKQSEVVDQISKIELITLHPLSNSNIMESCAMQHGLRI